MDLDLIRISHIYHYKGLGLVTQLLRAEFSYL